MAEQEPKSKQELEEAKIVFEREAAVVQGQLKEELGRDDVDQAVFNFMVNLDPKKSKVLQLLIRYTRESSRAEALRFALGEDDKMASAVREYREIARQGEDQGSRNLPHVMRSGMTRDPEPDVLEFTDEDGGQTNS